MIRIEAELVTSPLTYVSAHTVVALPPSAADAAAGTIKVYVNGTLVLREYDPVLEQP